MDLGMLSAEQTNTCVLSFSLSFIKKINEFTRIRTIDLLLGARQVLNKQICVCSLSSPKARTLRLTFSLFLWKITVKY